MEKQKGQELLLGFFWGTKTSNRILFLSGFGPAQCEPLVFTIWCIPIGHGIEKNFYIDVAIIDIIEMLTIIWLNNSMDR